MRRGFKTWAENLAVEVRQASGLRAEASLSARILADHLGVTVIGVESIPGISNDITNHLLKVDTDSWSAVTIVHNDCTVIIHNTAHSTRRQESDLMHELAHVLCEHHPSQIVQSPNLPFALRSYDKIQEEEAGWLGGCLQLPRSALLWAIERGMSEAAIINHFGASSDLVRYRRRMTGVDVQVNRRTRFRN